MVEEFNVVFRGDILPGQNILEVKQRIKDTFKLDDARVDRLFSGKVTYLKRNTAADVAEQFRQVMEQAGAIVEVRPAEKVTEKPSNMDEEGEIEDASDEEWTLAPVGANMLEPHERALDKKADISTDHLSMEPVGVDVLKPSERQQVEPVEIDTSQLSLED